MEELSEKDNARRDEIIGMLEANKQIVLTGAPGTGKTYLAKEIAEYLVRGNEQRYKQVQFHPGYDYSDFVIGLKPVLLDVKTGKKLAPGVNSANGVAVSYEWRSGVFKEFAEKALKAYKEDCAVGLDYDKIRKYVLVIDEINRADLSRVFGELFSLLEDDYRFKIRDGKELNADGIVLLNGERFVIPENLYIIGTMNDIDRSVDSMDFALRRRFAWREVTAEESADIIEKKLGAESPLVKPLQDAMRDLNAYIGGSRKITIEHKSFSLNLGPEYKIGGAIFANAKKCPEGGAAVVKAGLWKNYIRNILSEYLRGNQYRKEILSGIAKELFGIYEV